MEELEIPDGLDNNTDTKILYILGKYGEQGTHSFYPEKIRRATFYKWLKRLQDNKWVHNKRDSVGTTFIITPDGRAELLRRLKEHNLDFRSQMVIEKLRMEESASSAESFFSSFEIVEHDHKIEFLKLANEITLDKMSDIFNETQFNKLLLFLVLNHPKFYPENSFTKEQYLKDFNSKEDDKYNISRADLEIFLQKVVDDKEKYNLKFYKLNDVEENIDLYFRSDSTCGKIFEAVIEDRLKDWYYRKVIYEQNNEEFEKDLTNIQNEIIEFLIVQYQLFPQLLIKSVSDLVDRYLRNIREIIQEKQTELKYDFSTSIPAIILNEEFEQRISSDQNKSINLRSKSQEISYYNIGGVIQSNVFKKEFFANKNFSIVNKFFTLLSNKKFDKASELLRNNMRNLNFIETNILRFVYDNIAQKYENALNISNKLATYLPNSYLIDFFRAITYRNMKKYNQYENLINKTFLKFPDNVFLMSHAINILGNKREFDRALKILDEILKKDSNDIHFLFEKSEILQKMGKFEESLEILNEIIKLNPHNIQKIQEKIGIINEMREFKDNSSSLVEEVIRILDDRLENSSNKEEILLKKFWVFGAEGKTDKMIEVLDSLINLDPKNVPYFEYNINVLEELENSDDALAYISEKSDKYPNKTGILELKLKLLKKMDRYRDALKVAKILNESNPEELKYLNWIIEIASDYSIDDEGLIAVEKKLVMKTDEISSLQDKCNFLKNLKRFDDAVETYSILIKKNPKDSGYPYFKAEILKDIGLIEESLKTVNKGLKFHPKNILLLSLKIDLLGELNRNDEAIKWSEKFIGLYPENVNVNIIIRESIFKFNDKKQSLNKREVTKAIAYLKKGVSLLSGKNNQWSEKAEHLLKEFKKKEQF